MNEYKKATLIATVISDDEPFAQSDAIKCLAAEFLNLRKRNEELTQAIKKIPLLSGDYGESINNSFTDYTVIVNESVVYGIQRAIKNTASE